MGIISIKMYAKGYGGQPQPEYPQPEYPPPPYGVQNNAIPMNQAYPADPIQYQPGLNYQPNNQNLYAQPHPQQGFNPPPMQTGQQYHTMAQPQYHNPNTI